MEEEVNKDETDGCLSGRLFRANGSVIPEFG
jgi:hypothetical protein